jgi:uncharacterized DUF497 family protein
LLEFDWDEENLQHIARHGVTAPEAEYVLAHPTVDMGYQDWHEEERFSDAGATASGRIIVVVTTERNFRTRVVTSYDAPSDVKEKYYRLMVS